LAALGLALAALGLVLAALGRELGLEPAAWDPAQAAGPASVLAQAGPAWDPVQAPGRAWGPRALEQVLASE
jgi:hypothetical protein